MRVISQDGKIDVPYKIATILKRGNTILARNDRAEFELAEYSTKAKALKAMEMLREHNEGVIFLKTIINTEKGTSFVNCLSKTDFNKLTQNYFQFPQDDEIEV